MKTTLLFKILIFSALINLGLSQSSRLQAQGSGYSLEFDGIDDYVSVLSDSGGILNPQNAVTIESWVYLSEPASPTHRPHFLGKSRSYQLIIETNGLPRFWARANDTWYHVSGTTTIETGKWYHIAATYDGSEIQIYVNGFGEDTPLAMAPPLEQNPNDIRFGDRLGGIEALAGSMDEIRIWDVAKTEIELQDGMNMKLVGNEPNLIGYWRLDDGSGTTVTDLTANGNDGTFTNMDELTDWITSTAPIGDASTFAESTDISETSNCELDIVFGTSAEDPGTGFSLAAIQVDESPDNTTGILYTISDKYWEIWSEDSDFDDDFTATVQFHYDNISGIVNESDLVLYRRDSASAAAWSSVSGITIVTDDGASSTPGDGVGYVQLDITEATQGAFSGQYALGWNLPPVANADTDNTDEDTPVIIDVLDNDTDSDGILDPSTVAISSDPTQGTITNINSTTGEITYTPNSNYFGPDQFSYTVEDNGGAISGIALVDVTINSVNDTLVVTDIQDQTVDEGDVFATIILDDFVSDIEDDDTDIVWSWSGNTDLNVTIDGSRIATVAIPDENWNGSETILFTAEDLDGGQDSDSAIFTVTPVNDLPVVTGISDQTIDEGEDFATINLDDFVTDIEDTVSDITWTWSGNSDLTVDIDGNRVATIGIPDENWYGDESIIFIATDLGSGVDSDTATFTVTSVNDLPVVADIPNQTVLEGEVFSTISLDDYVSDVEDIDADITWSWTGNTELTVTIDGNRVVTVGIPNENWNGTESIIFTAEDMNGGVDMDTVTLQVSPDNDPPFITDIPDQTIDEGESFSIISLDDYVTDVEDADADIDWTWSGNVYLAVTIDNNRMVTIGTPNENWYGSETITFTATDLIGESSVESATFTVNPVNDAPIVLSHIPDTSGVTLEEFIFQFDSLTFDDIDVGDTLSYSASLTTGDLPDWLSFDDASRTFSGTPASGDIGTISVVVTASDLGMETTADTFDIQILRGPLGIEDLTQEWKLNLYPNPSDGNFFVNMSIPENEDIEMRIFNASGQLVQNENYLNQFGNVRMIVDLSGHKKGIYFIRIISRSGVANKQILIY